MVHPGSIGERDGDEPESFGEWLKQRRRAYHLTQGSLAERLYCALGTLRKIEADERHPSQELAERLAEVLQVPSEHRSTFISVARAELALDRLVLPPDPSTAIPPPMLPHTPSNLRLPRTSFIGREAELADLHALIVRPDVSLVTLTGPGGTGKTRLALEVATLLRDAFADGVWFVNLAPLRDPAMLASAVAHTLGVREEGGVPIDHRLTRHLRDKHLLLVLDNFEQVVDAAPMVGEMLVSAPRLKVLITSRIVLHLSGEYEVTVPSLALPARTQQVMPDQMGESEAVRLFMARAQAVKAGFTLTPENAPTIAEICQRVDGLPLAIELAAARVKLFSPLALLDRLQNRLTFLTGGARDVPQRHHTIRNTIDWSYGLLDDDEKLLFTQMSIFAGGCTLAAVEAVCFAMGDLPMDGADGIAALVDNSLLHLEDDEQGEPRVLMLETLREYALERLVASGAADVLREQHAAFYLRLAATAAAELETVHGQVWLARLDAEHDNLRAVLGWALAGGDVIAGFKMVGHLWRFWAMRGLSSEGRQWVSAFLAHRGGLPDDLTAEVLYAAGELAWTQWDSAGALAVLEESLALQRALGNTHQLAVVLHCMGRAMALVDINHATAYFEESLALFEQVGDQLGRARALVGLGMMTNGQGDAARATTLLEEALALGRQLGQRRPMFAALRELASIAGERGDMARATRLLDESVSVCRELGDKKELANTLIHAGELMRSTGDYDAAAGRYEESLMLCHEIGEWQNAVLALLGLGYVALHTQNDTLATARFRESLALGQARTSTVGVAGGLTGLAGLARVRQQPQRGARLLARADALLHAADAHLEGPDAVDYHDILASLRRELDATTFTRAWAEGQAMTMEQAVAYALGEAGLE